jgi:hypothetical protein
MLNEWSDRVPPSPRKPLLLRGSFWLGFMVAMASAALVYDLAARLLSLGRRLMLG